MRLRNDGPHIQYMKVPNGTEKSQQSISIVSYIPWENGSSGLICGVPCTMGVEIGHFGEYEITVHSAEFRKKVFDALAATLTSKPGAVPLVDYSYSYDYEEIQDIVTENYRRRIAAGEIINNPMTQVYSSYMAEPRAITIYTNNSRVGDDGWSSYRALGTNVCKVTVSLNAVVTVTSQAYSLTTHELIVENLRNRVSSASSAAIIGAFEKLQSAELDVAMMVAEGGETLKYLQLLVTRAAKLIRAITDPKTVFRYAPKALASVSKVGTAKALANAYLEARYALRPLLIDIDDTLKYLSAGKMAHGHDRYTYRKREANVNSGRLTIVVGGQPIVVDYSVEKSARAGVLSEAAFDVPGSNFGFMNWASIAFEKVKFSFILAWLVDIGGLLYRLNPNVKLRPLASWVTEVFSATYVATMTIDTPQGKQTITSSGSYREKSRNPIVDNLPPPITIAINIDSFKLLDLLAITSQIRAR